ncbi:hypothetical protein DM01DRAFT_1304250 [Hesseltinella vesiculosa]|uniref:Uncharacterized protein n=1 Tax=Hesseltinella vesiculosa TaxID=101127 RepID=A0A1X2GK01_9FUNG|nr:hypothetical protein DM01DRAFT_1304250 [Hesseltinella vesiculosa]
MSSVSHNEMGPVKPADDEARAVFHEVKEQVVAQIHKLRHDDQVHGLHEIDNLHKITIYKLYQYAVEEVSYGYNFFGKIEIDEGKFIHARAHKYHDGRIDFYSLHTEPENSIWTRDDPLVYFND